jgi:hypothetical protein
VYEFCWKRVDIEIYDGAGHAFENLSNQRGYRPKAAAVAWFEILKFFEQEKNGPPLAGVPGDGPSSVSGNAPEEGADASRCLSHSSRNGS